MHAKSIAALLGALILAAPIATPAQTADPAAPVTLGDLTIQGGFSRAMPPNAPVGGGYLTIANAGATDDRLLGATSPDAAQVQIHKMTMSGSVMKMCELPDGLAIPAGGTVALTPGGHHLMFVGVATPFVQGQVIHATLLFEHAGQVRVPLTVGPMNARSGAHAGHKGGDDHANH